MSSRLPRAVVNLCIRLEASAECLDRVGTEQVEAMAGRLFETLVRRQIPATWAVADPESSQIANRVAGSPAGQEIALAVEIASLGGPNSGARSLARRVSQARELGLRLTSIVADRPLEDGHFEALSRLGVRGVSGPRTFPASSRRHTQPAMPRFGLWCFADSVSLPGTSRWAAGGGGGRTVRHELDLAFGEQGLVQIGIDVPALAERGRAAERIVLRAIDLIERRRGIGKLDIATLESTAARLAGQCASKPSRSILRPAA